MASDRWDEIHGFTTPGEFKRFQAWLHKAISEGVLTEVPIEMPYSGSWMWDEHWYRTAAGTAWRVVAPDPPFLGVSNECLNNSYAAP